MYDDICHYFQKVISTMNVSARTWNSIKYRTHTTKCNCKWSFNFCASKNCDLLLECVWLVLKSFITAFLESNRFNILAAGIHTPDTYAVLTSSLSWKSLHRCYKEGTLLQESSWHINSFLSTCVPLQIFSWTELLWTDITRKGDPFKVVGLNVCSNVYILSFLSTQFANLSSCSCHSFLNKV